MATKKRWFVLSYDSTGKAYKQKTIKEDIAEFLLLLKVGTRDFNIRIIESYTDSTIHFALDTSSASEDYKKILDAFKKHANLSLVAFSLNLISIIKDTDEQLFDFIANTSIKNTFDSNVAQIKKDNKLT